MSPGPSTTEPGPSPPPDGPVVEPDAQRSSLRVEISSRTIWQAIGAILLTLLLLWAANATRSLLAMVAIAFFFSLAMEPAVRWLREHRDWRRGTAVGVIYAGAAVLGVLFVFVLIPAAELLAAVIAENGADWVARLNTLTDERIGLPLDVEGVGSLVADAADASRAWLAAPLGVLLGFASSTVGLIFNIATIALFTFYFSADAPKMKRAVLRRFSPLAQERVAWTWDKAIEQTGGYFYSRGVLFAINGVGFFVVMTAVGVPLQLAIPLAVFGGFVSEFIPAVGTYIGAALPFLVTLALRGVVGGLVVLLYAVVYQQIENYWLSPRITADSMTLSGGVAFGAALAGGAIAGPVGAFVALPVAALIASFIANYARSYEVADGADPDPGRTATGGSTNE